MAAGDFRRSNHARDYIQGSMILSSSFDIWPPNINLQQSTTGHNSPESLRDAPDLTYFIPGGVS